MNSVTDSFTIHDGVNANGTHSLIHVDGNSVISQKTYDAQPHLEYAAHARASTDGQRWGEGKFVGHIPPAQYAQFLMIRDNVERKKAIKKWLTENPAFVMFDRYLKK